MDKKNESMTISQVLKSFEDYYGPYPRPVIQEFVKKYLKSFKEPDLFILHNRVILEISVNKYVLPDVAALERIKRIINQERGDCRQKLIGSDFTKIKHVRKMCPAKGCGGEVLGGVCMKCGWSKSRPGKIE